MADLWCPFAKINAAPKRLWGPEQRADTGLLHSTESSGKFWPHPEKYYGHDGYPNATITEDAVWQHIPINRASRALKNARGGVETNFTNLIQIEIAGNAADIRNLPKGTLENLRRFMRWCEENSDIPRVSTVDWVAYPQSYGLHARQRLSGAYWTNYKGWLGHQHAPENDHGDPGDIDISWLLDGPVEQPDDKEEEFLDMDEKRFREVMKEIMTQEGFDDIELQRRTGLLKLWKMPDGTIAAQTFIDGRLAVQYHTDMRAVEAWQRLGVYPTHIPDASPQDVEDLKRVRVVMGT